MGEQRVRFFNLKVITQGTFFTKLIVFNAFVVQILIRLKVSILMGRKFVVKKESVRLNLFIYPWLLVMFTNLVTPLLILQKTKSDPIKIHVFVVFFHFVVVAFIEGVFFVVMFLFLPQENEQKFVVSFVLKLVEQATV